MSKLRAEVMNDMKNKYYSEDDLYLDWMGNRITNSNFPTYHHIEKKCDLKKQKKDTAPTIENGAYLGKKSHEQLHRVEHMDHELYECYNYIFKVIVNMGIYPIDDVWKMVDGLNEKTKKLEKRKNVK